jgi:hypothetical protein
MFTNDIDEYIVNNYCTLDREVVSWWKAMEDGLKNIRQTIEEDDNIDPTAEGYLPMNEEEIRNRVERWIEFDWDNLLAELKNCDLDGACLIDCSCGTWRGRRDGFTFASSILDAVEKCVLHNYYKVTITQVNGHIEIEGIHHDGCDYFEIYLLNEKGKRIMDRLEDGCEVRADITDGHYHKALPHYFCNY